MVCFGTKPSLGQTTKRTRVITDKSCPKNVRRLIYRLRDRASAARGEERGITQLTFPNVYIIVYVVSTVF